MHVGVVCPASPQKPGAQGPLHAALTSPGTAPNTPAGHRVASVAPLAQYEPAGATHASAAVGRLEGVAGTAAGSVSDPDMDGV